VSFLFRGREISGGAAIVPTFKVRRAIVALIDLTAL
jgi:hypothetical protein